MKTKISLLVLVAGLMFTLSCTKYPPQSERLLEDLAVITQYDTKVDFNQFKTFAIADQIMLVTDKDTTLVNSQDANSLLNQVRQNMSDRGFTEVQPNANPDLGIQVTAYKNTYVYAYTYYNYWGYYYGWYYPYYPVYYSSYTAGLASIDLFDLKNKTTNGGTTTIKLRWNGYIRGLLTGSHTNAEILGAVDQAFTQTPQLKTTAN